jgi:hypothetical protein
MFLRRFFLSLAFFLSFLNSYSQKEDREEKDLQTLHDTVVGWRKTGNLRISFSQAHFENWAAGGHNNYAANSLFESVFIYKKEKVNWQNRIEIAYGFIHREEIGIVKSDDKIDFVSNYSFKAYNDFNYSALINFRTQMAPGYFYSNDSVLISDFLAPAFMVTSIGMNYKPQEDITFVLSPLSGKLTIVNNKQLSNEGAYGVEPGKKLRAEFGAHFKAMIRKEILENITLQSTLDLFSNYLVKPENIDINWETMIILKVNKYITANISMHLIYDDDIEIQIDKTGDGMLDSFAPRTQFKEILSIGLSFKF